MTTTRIFIVLLAAITIISVESCRPRASKNRTTKKQPTQQPQQTASNAPSASQVMHRADSVLAKVGSMNSADLDIANVQPQDYPQSPNSMSGYVPRPDLTAYSNYQAALAAYNASDYEQAISLLSQIIINGNPPELVPNAYYWLGECFYAEGRFADATQYFEYTTQVGPTYKKEVALYKLARCNYSIGNTQAASMWFERLRAEYPNTKYSKALRKIGVQ
ncbi:MAG TPA: tetratricopeptide repeat protein [Candidatus Kapabacteria bacterium]|nr:tetratricopeptide repeat protein [Candidatus Kapabacteria bacterium]